jgi:hypothetical protein
VTGALLEFSLPLGVLLRKSPPGTLSRAISRKTKINPLTQILGGDAEA